MIDYEFMRVDFLGFRVGGTAPINAAVLRTIKRDFLTAFIEVVLYHYNCIANVCTSIPHIWTSHYSASPALTYRIIT